MGLTPVKPILVVMQRGGGGLETRTLGLHVSGALTKSHTDSKHESIYMANWPS